MLPHGYPREVGFANRWLLVLRPRRPMIEWVRSCDPTDPITDDEVARATEAMMIPVFDTSDEAFAWIEENADALFEVALGSWFTAPELWPSQRDWATLREWFDIELVDLIWDVVDAPLTSEPETGFGGGGGPVEPYGGAPPEGGGLDGGIGGGGEWN